MYDEFTISGKVTWPMPPTLYDHASVALCGLISARQARWAVSEGKEWNTWGRYRVHGGIQLGVTQP